MSQLCAVPTCKRLSCALCSCCQRYICKPHFNEHCESLNSQLNPLTDEINALSEQLNSFDIHKTTIESREKLEQWRVECHQKIDLLFEKKCRELDQSITQKVYKQAEQIDQIRTKLLQLIHDEQTTCQDLNSIKSAIFRFKIEINNIENTFIQINPRPLAIGDKTLHITETLRPKIDLLTLSPADKTLDQSHQSYWILASNNKFLLIHQAPKLCLVNPEMNTVEQILCPFDKIIDMCWSSTLERFILINENGLFLINENLTLIEKVNTIENMKWLACTCSDRSLFLLTNALPSLVIEFNLLPKIELNKQWHLPNAYTKSEQIDSIVYNNGTLALIIRNMSEKTIRMELRFAATLDCVWSLPLDIICKSKLTFHCCSLSFDEWLMADYQNCRLLHITKCGQIKAMINYKTVPYRIHLFNQNVLVILTKQGKNLHQLV